MLTLFNRFLINQLGRDHSEYLASNTMNLINQKLNPFIWTYDLKALVLKRVSENPEVITVSLLPNQHWQGAIAGQYIDLQLLIDGQPYQRSYSISAISDQAITITIKKIKGGKVSEWLHQHLKTGQILDISQAKGSFVYQDQAKLLLICAGTGITPGFSIVSDLLNRPLKTPDIQFFAQFSTQDDLIFSQKLKSWAKKIQLRLAFSQTKPETRLSAANFKQYFPDFQQRSIYLCGPEGFMHEVIAILEQENYDLSQLKVEKFVTAPFSNRSNQACSSVYFKHYNTTIPLSAADQHKTLLEIGLENGLNLEKGCERGICGSCKLVLHAGAVTGNTLGQAVYLCTAYANSETVVLGT